MCFGPAKSLRTTEEVLLGAVKQLEAVAANEPAAVGVQAACRTQMPAAEVLRSPWPREPLRHARHASTQARRRRRLSKRLHLQPTSAAIPECDVLTRPPDELHPLGRRRRHGSPRHLHRQTLLHLMFHRFRLPLSVPSLHAGYNYVNLQRQSVMLQAPTRRIIHCSQRNKKHDKSQHRTAHRMAHPARGRRGKLVRLVPSIGWATGGCSAGLHNLCSPKLRAPG